MAAHDVGLDRDREAAQLVIDALGAALAVDGISPDLRRSLLLSRADLAAHFGDPAAPPRYPPTGRLAYASVASEVGRLKS